MRMRWVIVGLLFFATTINYLDRAILGVILPEIREKFHFGLPVYGTIQMVFQFAYAGGSLLGGRLLDRYGTRVGYGMAAALWSLAATLNAFAGSALQFGLFRTVLGFGESANFPACSKAAAEWFPPDERAHGHGNRERGDESRQHFRAAAFHRHRADAGLAGVLRHHGRTRIPLAAGLVPVLSAAAESWRGDVGAHSSPIGDVMKYKQAWGYGLAKFLTDPVWWFYLFWLPTYLTDVRHFTPQQRGTALMIVYSISAVGALLGGVVSSFLMKRGWTVGKARKMTLLFCAIVMPACALGVAWFRTRDWRSCSSAWRPPRIRPG